MKYLFIHPNFPAQFLYIAPALIDRGHQVLALAPDSNSRRTLVPTARYPTANKIFPTAVHGMTKLFASSIHTALEAARGCEQLKARGYVPDVIVVHPGWGHSLLLKEVWSSARLVLYSEFFYQTHGLDTDFDPEFLSMDIGTAAVVRANQAAQMLAINDADFGISPTKWQASTFPSFYQPKINIVHDGIATEFINQDKNAAFEIPDKGLVLKNGDEVITFVSRNLEPYRGYHIFMRALPRIIKERKNAHVVIVGGSGTSYGVNPPDGTSWKEIFLREVSDRLDLSRVHFVGTLPRRKYLNLLQITRVHVYLTYPFVLSWSMLEAMSVGALVIGSKTPPVQEVILDGQNGLLVDFFDVDAWVSAVVGALSEPDRFQDIRHQARQTVVRNYDLKTVCIPRLVGFLEGIA